MGSCLPPTSGQMTPTSGSSDWPNWDPHIAYRGGLVDDTYNFCVAGGGLIRLGVIWTICSCYHSHPIDSIISLGQKETK